MSKDQTQQPAAPQNPQAKPLQVASADVAPTPQFSNPTADLFGANSAGASGHPPATGDFWADYDKIAQQAGGNSPNARPTAAMPASPTGGWAAQPDGPMFAPRMMDGPGGAGMLPPGAIQSGGGEPTPGRTMIGQAPPGTAAGDTSTPYGSTVGSVPLGNVPALPGAGDLSGAMKTAQDAAYKNATGYLDPQFQNSQAAMESKLANQGVTQNSEAWNKAMDDFARQKEFAYSQARSGAVQQGNAAQSQLFNQGLASNQNQFGQNLQGGQFSNAVQEQLARQGFTQQQITNMEQQNRFQNSMTMRNQDINELLLQQQNPLNMMNALNNGGQVQQPNFTNTPGANVGGTDIASIIQQYMGQGNNVYNAQTGAANSSNAGMAAIIAALLCDRRLKKNIRMIGVHVVGVPLYEFDYLWGEHAIGVMADELEVVMPEAVHTLHNGFKFVDYARL